MCLELLKPIYELADSGDQLHETLDDHIQIDLEMTPTIIDPFLYTKFENDQIRGVNSRYVDDIHQAGNDEWMKQVYAALERFE